jgi:hypothetical protein
MGSLVSDQEFLIALVTSLPESWDSFTSLYLAANSGKLTATTNTNVPSSSTGPVSPVTITSHELVALILEEYRRKKEKAGESSGSSAMFGKNNQHGKSGTHAKDGCFNCRAAGHMAKDCWSKGGSKKASAPRITVGKVKGDGKVRDKETRLIKVCTRILRTQTTMHHSWPSTPTNPILI